jgi:integrase
MRGHIRQRAAGSWTIEASGGFDDAGRRVRITRTVRATRRDAERALTKLLREVDTGTATANGSTTLSRFLEETWLPHTETRVRPTTLRRYTSLVRVQISPRIGRVKLAKLRPVHIQSVIDAMVAEGAAPASVLQAHRVLSSALSQAVRWQLLSVNPCAAVRPPRADRKPLTVPTADETRAIVRAASDTYEVPVLLCATTGMRRGEVLGLQWSAVDFDAGKFYVERTLQKVRGEVRFVTPKTDRSRRSISLPPSVTERLRRHRKEQAERRMLVGPAWSDLGLVVDRGDGQHLDPDTFSHAYSRIAASAGVPGARLHDLRHAFATTLLAAGVHPKVVSEALGHSSVAFTMDTYQHVLPTMGDQVASAIETALGG